MNSTLKAKKIIMYVKIKTRKIKIEKERKERKEKQGKKEKKMESCI